MREVIEKIIATENEAKAIVDAAAAEADRLLAAAKERAGEVVEQARLEARREGARIVAEAARAAEEEKRLLLREAASRIESGIGIDGPTRERAVQAVVRCVCGLR